MDRGTRRERGFTLVEVMLVVAIVAVLAFIAVPSFFKESRRGKAESEINAVLTELALKEEQYKQDNGVYLTAAQCPSTLPSFSTGTAASTCLGTGSPWTNLRVVAPLATLRCSYAITAGTASTTASNPGGFTFTSPAMNWFYIIATCNADNNSTLDSTYFISSIDSKIQSQNVGK